MMLDFLLIESFIVLCIIRTVWLAISVSAFEMLLLLLLAASHLPVTAVGCSACGNVIADLMVDNSSDMADNCSVR
jgi:hypothetical protein